MPIEAIEGIAALLALGMIGTFVLTGIRMKWKHKENLARASSAEFEQLADAVDALGDQVRVLTEETADLQERLDFTERLLTSQRPDEPVTPT